MVVLQVPVAVMICLPRLYYEYAICSTCGSWRLQGKMLRTKTNSCWHLLGPSKRKCRGCWYINMDIKRSLHIRPDRYIHISNSKIPGNFSFRPFLANHQTILPRRPSEQPIKNSRRGRAACGNVGIGLTLRVADPRQHSSVCCITSPVDPCCIQQLH